MPSKVFLDKPYPPNLPVVGCCDACNNKFSLDEQYVSCAIECVLSGTTLPEKLKRNRIADILRKHPSLQALIAQGRVSIDGRIAFTIDQVRLRAVVLKLARGHAAFEHSQIRQEEPSHYWVGTLDGMAQDVREQFNAIHVIGMLGEIGSRGQQRVMVVQAKLVSDDGEERTVEMLAQDWIEVQEGQYRYLAIDDRLGVCVRLVISEYIACEVAWIDDSSLEK